MADWWESTEAWKELEEADKGFTEWAHAYKREHGFFPGGGQDESLAQAISNREWSKGVASERGSGPTQKEWVSHYYRPDEMGDTGQFWPYAVGAVSKAFPETGSGTSKTPDYFGSAVAQKQYGMMAPYWEQMARFGVGKAGGTATSGAPTTDYDALVTDMATERGIDPALARAILYWESSGNPDIRGADGEVGLMQVIPSDMSDRFSWAATRPSAADMATPEAQIKAGLDVLEAALASAGGDVEEALSYYNSGGPKAGAPDSTRNAYIPGVMSLYQQMRGKQSTRSQGSGGAAPQVTYNNEPNPDNAYMMREDGGEKQRVAPVTPGVPGTERPHVNTRRNVTAADPTQQTLGAIINALINAYPQAAGTAIDRWNQGIDARDRGFTKAQAAIDRLPVSPVDPNAPIGEPGNLETLYRRASEELGAPQKPGPVSTTDALNRMRQSPNTPPVYDIEALTRIANDPNSTQESRERARADLMAARHAPLSQTTAGQQTLGVVDEVVKRASDVAGWTVENVGGLFDALGYYGKALGGGVADMFISPTAFLTEEVRKALSSVAPDAAEKYVSDVVATVGNAIPTIVMPTLGDVGRAALTGIAQGDYLAKQMIGFVTVGQMTPDQLDRLARGERLRQDLLDLRAAGMEDSVEYREALYRWQQYEASEKARYEATIGRDVSRVPGIQQIEGILGGFLTPEQKAAELARLEQNPSAVLRYLNDPDLADLVATISDPTKRAAAWEAGRAGTWSSGGLNALTYMQLLGVDTGDWEATIQKAATYQNIGSEMLGGIIFDFYNLPIFGAPGKAVYNRFMNRGKNYWIADVGNTKTLDAVHGDILKAGQERSVLDTILPGSTVDSRRANLLNKLSVSMQMATEGAETADEYVGLLSRYTADPAGFLDSRALPKSQGMLEGSAILREYAGFGVKEVRVKRYTDDLARAVQDYKTAKTAGTATDEMVDNVKRLRRRLDTAKRAEPAESLAKRLDRVADQGVKVHGLAGADLREYVQEEALALLQKTIDGFIPESSANLLEKGLKPVMNNRFYQGFMKVLVAGHMGLNPGWLMRNITSDAAISMIDGYNPFRSAKSVRKFIDEFGIEPRSVSKAAPIGRQVGAGGSDIGVMGIQSHVERFGGEKVYTEAAGHTLRNLNRQAVDAYLSGAPKGMFTPAQEAYLRHIGERSLSEKQFRAEMARVFSGTAHVDTVLGPATWKQAYDLNIEDELKKLVEAKDDTTRATIRKAQNQTIDKHADSHPLKDHPRVDSDEGKAIQQIRKNPQTYDPAKMSTQELEQHVAELEELAPTTTAPATAAEAVPQNRLNWRSSVHAKRYRPYLEAKSKVLKATEDIANLPKSADAERIWGNLVSAQEQADTAFAHARQVWDEAKAKLATDGRTGDVSGMFIHADNTWAKAAREGSEELNKAYQDYMNWHKSVTGKWPVTPRAGKTAAVGTPVGATPAAKTSPAPLESGLRKDATHKFWVAPNVSQLNPGDVVEYYPADIGAHTSHVGKVNRGRITRIVEQNAGAGKQKIVYVDIPSMGEADRAIGSMEMPSLRIVEPTPETLKAMGKPVLIEDDPWDYFANGPSDTRELPGWSRWKANQAAPTVEAAPQVARAEEAAAGGPQGAWAEVKEEAAKRRAEMPNVPNARRISKAEWARQHHFIDGQTVWSIPMEAATPEGWTDALSSAGNTRWKFVVRESELTDAQRAYIAKNAPSAPAPKGVAGAVADETGSLDLTSIKGQAAHTKRFLDDVAERLKGRPGLSKVEPLSDAGKKYLRENYAEYMKFLNKNRLVAANYGEHARHFAYHNYDGKTSADQLASLLLMYPFWSTRTYAKLPLRVMQHPGLAAKYLRYKRWLAEENKDLPEWYRDKIVIDNTKIPWLPEELIIDLEASINPYNSMNREPFDRPRQLEGEGMDLVLGKYMQFAEKYGFNAHFGIIAAYAAAKMADGDADAAKAAMGYPAPALRAIRDITAWMGMNNGWGIELVPWHWRQGLKTPFTGADYYAQRRIASQIGKLALSGQITPLEAREAAIAYARGETDNPIIRKALEAETDQRGVFNFLGFLTSFSVKGRSGYDRQVDEAKAEEQALYANAASMTDEEFLRAQREFYGNPDNYHLRVASMARSELDKAETDYIRDIWWNSIPPGQTDVAIAKYGDEGLEVIIEEVLKGDGIGALSEEERIRLNMFMAGLSAVYPPPDQEMFGEWRAATDAWNRMEAAAAEKFGGSATIGVSDALNMMRQGQGQPPQSEFDRIMEAFWAADPETKKAMKEQYPVIDQYLDWRTDYLENDPLLAWYYAEPPREQATTNLWNLYNAYTDSGMAQTKVDLAEDLDAMGADMGIPGCELDEEGDGCFSKFFRNQDTRDYEQIPNELLLAWTLYIASEAAKRGVDPNVYRTQEGEAAGTQTLAPEPSGGDPAIVTSPWQMGESNVSRSGLPGTDYEQTYGAGAPGLQVPTDVPGKAVVPASSNGLGTSTGGLDVATDAPGSSAGGSGGKSVATGDGGAELTPPAATGEKSFWDFDFTEEQFERAAPEMDALRTERNRLYKMCDQGVEQACNQLKDDRFNVFSTPEWLFYYEQIVPGWRSQDSGFYDDPLIKQWLDPATRDGVSAGDALKRMQELKAALPDLSFGDPKEYSQARDEQEQWKETSQNLMPGTMAYRQAQAKYADEHPVWAKYYLRPKTAASLAEYAARGWTYAPRSGGDGSDDGGGTSGGSGYRYTGPWFSPDTFRGANTSRRPAVQDSDLWQRVVMAALSRTKQ